MEALSEIRRHIQALAGRTEGLLFTAKVEGVNGETCTVSVDGLALSDVRLRSVVNDDADRVMITPRVGSYVLVADMSGGKYCDLVVLQYSEAETIEITVGNSAISITDNSIEINGGGNYGLVKIYELTQKLNGLKDTVNALVNAFNSHTHVVATTGTAAAQTGTAEPVVTAATTATAFVQSDYEDDKIKH